jgi:hypothetical protein
MPQKRRQSEFEKDQGDTNKNGKFNFSFEGNREDFALRPAERSGGCHTNSRKG